MTRSYAGRILIASSLFLLPARAASAADAWPGLRGPRADGAVPGQSLGDGDPISVTLGWKVPLGSGYASLAVGDAGVIALFADGDADYAGAFDPATGKEKWRYRIADTYSGHDG